MMNKKTKIAYVDLGLHKRAPEIEMFRGICESLGFDYSIYGIEADPEYIPGLKERYKDDPKIQILNYAIGDREGFCELYRSAAFDGEGSSIYKTKNNVKTENFARVPMVRLSHLLPSFNLGDFAVLKWNIEGAELLMVQDLIKTKTAERFDLFCGATPDIHKVSEIADQQEGHVELMNSAGISPFLFHNHYNPEKVQQMKTRMAQELRLLTFNHNASKHKEPR